MHLIHVAREGMMNHVLSDSNRHVTEFRGRVSVLHNGASCLTHSIRVVSLDTVNHALNDSMRRATKFHDQVSVLYSRQRETVTALHVLCHARASLNSQTS